ncbi:MAG TPA: Na+/H+ antiporter [Caulobacteraceae bacterium]|jgi:CPA1 family monovalent cation:H+ antiporter
MQSVLIIVAALLAVTALADWAADRLRTTLSIALVVLGAALSFVPGMPAVTIDPRLALLLFLPPLVYSSGVGMSWRGFRKNLWPILFLATGCVLFTASAVAGVGRWLLGMAWAPAFVLGAVVSPPDPVAPMAVARRLKLPTRLLTILEGEGVANDATALILLSFALAAVRHEGVSLVDSIASFVLIVVGELAWGLAVGWATLRIRHAARSPQVEMVISLLTPFVAFWPPHMLGGSGVLAALAGGLHVSWFGPRFISPPTRLQGYFVWGLLTHVLEGVLFLLMGLQAHTLVAGLGGKGWTTLAFAGAAVTVAVIVVRFVWVFPATFLRRWLRPAAHRRDPEPSWQSAFVISFAGIRGVVSLIAALSIPVAVSGHPFPGRNVILFVTFCVIIATLVGQGSLLPFVLKRLGMVAAGEAEDASAKAHEIAARVLGVEAALAELDALERQGAPPFAVAGLRRLHQDRRTALLATADPSVTVSPVAEAGALQSRLILAERRRIAEIYRRGEITDEARRRVERELDLEDARNRHALESATGDSLGDPQAEARIE